MKYLYLQQYVRTRYVRVSNSDYTRYREGYEKSEKSRAQACTRRWNKTSDRLDEISPSVRPVGVVQRINPDRIRVLGDRVAVVPVLEETVPLAATAAQHD